MSLGSIARAMAMAEPGLKPAMRVDQHLDVRPHRVAHGGDHLDGAR